MTLTEYFRKNDVFTNDCGAQITECEPGRAVLTLRTEERHLSRVGRPHIHAGVLYTLAESASAAAMLSYGWNSYAVEGTISYLGAAEGGTITAVAKGRDTHEGETGQCRVRITAEDGSVIAQAKFMLYYTGEPFHMEQT